MVHSDVSSYARSLLLSEPLRETVINEIIQFMQLPLSSRGLDIGCGIGLNTFRLAESIGSAGQVIGLDTEEGLLAIACSRLNGSGVKEQVGFISGDAGDLPFAEQTFDWAYSMDCVGMIPVDPVILLQEISRVVKPGGRVYIVLWSSQVLLPGFPFLETRFNATAAGIAPFTEGMEPDRHIMRGLEWFNKAGLKENQVHTFVRDICSPLKPEIRDAMLNLFEMRWGSMQKEVVPEIWQEYQRLCCPDSPDFILDIPGYYGFFTYTVFSGRV